jgi:ribosomal protein S18 acetylase RimI-like enzyme
VEIRKLGPADEALIVAGGELFDESPRPDAIQRFLSTPNHHIFFAITDGKPVGFVSGVELTHPDKGTEMFLYELAVDKAHQGRGIGKALVAALHELADEKGCYDMWVLTDDDNEAALRTYRAAGSTATSSHLMLTWPINASSQGNRSQTSVDSSGVRSCSNHRPGAVHP